MPYSHLTFDELLKAQFETERAVDALLKYQTFLTSGAGLPKDDVSRSELLESSSKLLERLRLELDKLRQERSKRLGPKGY
jgi:hypothetical protein